MHCQRIVADLLKRALGGFGHHQRDKRAGGGEASWHEEYAADKVAKVREMRSRAARGENVLQTKVPEYTQDSSITT